MFENNDRGNGAAQLAKEERMSTGKIERAVAVHQERCERTKV